MCRRFNLSLWIAGFVSLPIVTTCMTRKALYRNDVHDDKVNNENMDGEQDDGLTGGNNIARNLQLAKEVYNGNGEAADDMVVRQGKPPTSVAIDADCQGQDQTTVWTFVAPWTNVNVPLPINSTVELRCFYTDCNPSQRVAVFNSRTDEVISSLEQSPAKTKRRFRKPEVNLKSCRDMGLYRCMVIQSTRSLTLTLLVQCPPEFNKSQPTTEVKVTGGTAVVKFSVRSPTTTFPTCRLTFASRQTNCTSYRSQLTVDGQPPDLTLRLTLNNLTPAESGRWTLALANGFTGSAGVAPPTTATATFEVSVAEGSTKPAIGGSSDKEGVSPPVEHDNISRSPGHWLHLIKIVAPVCAAFIVIVVAVTGVILFRRAGRRRDQRPYIMLRGNSLQDEIYTDVDADPYDNFVEGVVSPVTPLLHLKDLSVHTHRQAASLCSLKTLADQSSHKQRWSSFPSEVTDKKRTVQPVRTAIRTPADQIRSKCTNVYQTSLTGKDASQTADDLPAAKEKIIDDSASAVTAFGKPWVKVCLKKIKDSGNSSALAVALQEDKNLCEIYGKEDVDDKDSRCAFLGGDETGDVYEIEDCPDSRSSEDTEGYYSNDSACPADNQWDQMEDVYENTEVLMGCNNSNQPDDVYGKIPQRPGDSDDYEVPVIPPTATSFARPDVANGRLDAAQDADASRQKQAGNLACRPLPARDARQAVGRSEAATLVIRNEEGYIPMNPFP